jgi:DNA-binding transcriptional ArsR family regulator
MDTTPPPTDPQPDGPGLVGETARLDSQRLRTLSHPLRLRLLSALRLYGPATATELARRLDTNSGQTSYHLRQLAEVGLIEDDPDHSTQRDRYWRAAHENTSWSSRQFRDDPDDWAADTALLGQVVRMHARWLDEALTARDTWDPAWLGASDMGDAELHLTPDRLRQLNDDIHAVISHHLADQEHDAPDAERVTVLWASFPHPEPTL